MTKLKEQEEILVQEVPEGNEEEEELQECSDHHPSSYEKGKPGSILSPPNFL